MYEVVAQRPAAGITKHDVSDPRRWLISQHLWAGVCVRRAEVPLRIDANFLGLKDGEGEEDNSNDEPSG